MGGGGGGGGPGGTPVLRGWGVNIGVWKVKTDAWDKYRCVHEVNTGACTQMYLGEHRCNYSACTQMYVECN